MIHSLATLEINGQAFLAEATISIEPDAITGGTIGRIEMPNLTTQQQMDLGNYRQTSRSWKIILEDGRSCIIAPSLMNNRPITSIDFVCSSPLV